MFFSKFVLSLALLLNGILVSTAESAAVVDELNDKLDAGSDRSGSSDNYVRFGRSQDQSGGDAYKRQSADYVRFGRAAANSMDPTALREYLQRSVRGGDYVRFGRSGDQNIIPMENDGEEKIIRYTDEGERLAALNEIANILYSQEDPADDILAPISANLEKRNAEKTYVRMGRSFEEELAKRSNRNFIRMGRRSMYFPAKKAKSYIRMGRNADMEKKASRNYIRMGRAIEPTYETVKRTDGNFIRMGRNNEMLKYVDADNEFGDKRGDANLLEMGQSLDDQLEALSETESDGTYVRMGRNLLSINDNGNDESDVESLHSRTVDKKSAKSYIRMGKSLNDAEKRANRNYIRMGRSNKLQGVESFDAEKNNGTFIEASNKMKGDQKAELEKVIGSFETDSNNNNKSIVDLQRDGRGFVRMGKSDAVGNAEHMEDKRKSNRDYIRMGKKANSEDEGMSDLNDIGKRAKTYIRMGKRLPYKSDLSREMDSKRANYVRMGRADNIGLDIEDEAEAGLTEDKRAANRHYVRFGRNFDEDELAFDKRSKHYVRFGKRNDGRLLNNMENVDYKVVQSKRPSGGDYVRFG